MFLGFKISKLSDRFAGHIDPNVLCGSIGIADEGSNSAGVEDAIKITTGGLGSVSELVAGSLNLCAGIVGLLQTFCSFIRLFEQQGVPLCSSSALGDEAKQDLARVDRCISETQPKSSARTAALALTAERLPRDIDTPVPPGIALRLHCCPDCFEIAMH